MFAACALYCLYIRFPKKLAWGIGGGLLCIALRFMPAGHVPTLIFRGALGFVFMLAGNLLNKPLTEFKTWKICVAFALTAAAAAMYLKLSINNSFFSGKLDNPVLYLVSGICGTYFVMGIARLIPWKWVGCIGQNALTIMGTHQLVLYTVKIGSSPLWVVGSFLLIAAVEAVLILRLTDFAQCL